MPSSIAPTHDSGNPKVGLQASKNSFSSGAGTSLTLGQSDHHGSQLSGSHCSEPTKETFAGGAVMAPPAGRTARAASRVAEPSAEVRTLRTRLAGLQGGGSSTHVDHHRATFDLKNKVNGLLLAVKREDGDVSSHSSSGGDETRPSPGRSYRSDGRAVGGRGTKRVFGGQKMRVSLRTKFVDVDKIIPAEADAAKVYEKRIAESKRKWRQVSHTFGTVETALYSRGVQDGDGDGNDGGDDHPDGSIQTGSTQEGEGALIPRRKSMSQRAGIRGKARELWRGNPTDENWDGESTEDDEEETTNDGGPNQMSLRVREAVFGCDDAYHAAMATEKEKRREAARRLRERQRRASQRLSIVDASATAAVSSPDIFEKATTLWATEDDAGEMYAEFIGCVRSHNADWKARFLPKLPTGCSRQHTAAVATAASATDRSSSLASGGRGDLGCGGLAPLLPESRLQDAVAAARGGAAKPSLTLKGPHLPGVDCSAISRLVVDLVDAAAKANSVVCHTSSTSRARVGTALPPLPEPTHPKYRCPHCNLRPVATDNQALLDTLHSLAQEASLANTVDSVTDHEAETVAALNVDASVYTGIVADGAGWGLIDAVAAKLPREIIPTSLMDLDRVMWREVASWVIRREEQAVMAEGSVPPSGGTAAQRNAAEQFETYFTRFLASDSRWQRQQGVVQLTREKELHKLTRARDTQRRLYNSNLSTLRAIQLDCDAGIVELAAMKRRGDVAELVANHQQLIALERESEALTVALCDAEFTRRGLKKWLSKVSWTAEGLRDGASRLRELRGTMLSLVNECRDSLTPLQSIQLRETDVAKPIDDTDAARTIYGRCKVAEAGRSEASNAKDDDGSVGSTAPRGNKSIVRLRAFVASKLQPRKVDFASIKAAVERAQLVDVATDDALADVDEILRSAKADAASRHHQQDGGTSIANLTVSRSQPEYDRKDDGPAADGAALLQGSIRRLLGTRCKHCDHFLGASKYCFQTGDLHASYAPRTRNQRSALTAPPGGIQTSEDHCGTAYRLMCVHSDLALNARSVLRPDGVSEAADDAEREEDVSRDAASTAASYSQADPDWTRGDEGLLESSIQVGAARVPKEHPARRSTKAPKPPTASYADRKRKKAATTAARRRSSVMLARMGDRKWEDEVQADSSDSDSELEYAELDHDSEEEDVLARRQSVAAMLVANDVRGRASTNGLQPRRPTVGTDLASPPKAPRRGSLATFQFGDALPPSDATAEELPAEEDDATDDGDDAVVSTVVTRRRQSAVKERISKRRKLKDTVLRIKQNNKHIAHLVAAVQDGAPPQEGGDGASVDTTSKRFADMATVNLLSILNHELKWRMMAPLGEGLPPPPLTMVQAATATSARSPTSFPKSDFTFGSQHGPGTPPDEGAPDAPLLLRKYLKSVSSARFYDTIKPPTTSISTAPGSAAASLAAAAGTSAIGGSTGYQLWYPTNQEWRAALQDAENDWVGRISPLIVALSEAMLHRAHKLRGLAAGRQRRPFDYHDLPSTPPTVPVAGAPPPAARPKKVGARSNEVVAGETATVSPEVPTKLRAPKKPRGKKPVVVPTAASEGEPVPVAASAAMPTGPVRATSPRRPQHHPAPVPAPPRVSPPVKQKPVTESQLTFQIERLKGVMELAFQPAKQILVRLQHLERQLDELNRQLRPAQK